MLDSPWDEELGWLVIKRITQRVFDKPIDPYHGDGLCRENISQCRNWYTMRIQNPLLKSVWVRTPVGRPTKSFSFFMCFYYYQKHDSFQNNHHNRYLLPQVWWIKTVYIDWWCNREHALREQVSYRFKSCKVKHSDILAELVTNFILSASELIVAVVLSEVQWQVLSNQNNVETDTWGNSSAWVDTVCRAHIWEGAGLHCR